MFHKKLPGQIRKKLIARKKLNWKAILIKRLGTAIRKLCFWTFKLGTFHKLLTEFCKFRGIKQSSPIFTQWIGRKVRGNIEEKTRQDQAALLKSSLAKFRNIH